MKSLREEIAPLREEMASLREEITPLREEMASLREEITPLREEIARLREGIARLRDGTARLRDLPAGTPESWPVGGAAGAISVGLSDPFSTAIRTNVEVGRSAR